jgi:hypothetical protein
VGYNPLRKYRGTKATEITILVVFLVVIAALVIWASR